MTKTTESFDPDTYAPVADRITLFYQRFPSGRILTELVSRTEHEVLFKALVYRSPEEGPPAATGWAAEREGDGDVNVVACLENTETSAIGRALANLGFTAGRQRPSAEEMEKAARARLRLSERSTRTPTREVAGARAPVRRTPRPLDMLPDDPLQQRANLVLDLLRLIGRAEHAGLRRIRAQRWRAR